MAKLESHCSIYVEATSAFPAHKLRRWVLRTQSKHQKCGKLIRRNKYVLSTPTSGLSVTEF